jgi:hypothetical protein
MVPKETVLIQKSPPGNSLRPILFIVMHLLLALLLATTPVYAASRVAAVEPPRHAERSFPTPAFDGLLFYIQRDPNSNTICYELNLAKNGALDPRAPVKPFWIRYAEDGARTDLTYIQKTFAYGIKSKQLGDQTYELRAIAYPKHPLTLKKNAEGTYRIFTQINQKEAILQRIFIRIDGGSFWSPNVLYIEISGKDLASGQSVTQKIIPR